MKRSDLRGLRSLKCFSDELIEANSVKVEIRDLVIEGSQTFSCFFVHTKGREAYFCKSFPLVNNSERLFIYF